MPCTNLRWFRDVVISEKLHEVFCVNNDDFDIVQDTRDMAIVIKLNDIIKNSIPTAEFIMHIQAIIVNCIFETQNDISSIWDCETITQNDERKLKSRTKQAERKISFLLVGFIKTAYESSDQKWILLRPYLIESLKAVLYANLQLIGFAPHHTVVNEKIQKKYLQTKQFLTEVSTIVWYSVLFELEESFQIDDFIDIFRKLAMLDIFDEDWNLSGSWYNVLEDFSTEHGFQIQRTVIDHVLQVRTIEQRGRI